MNRKRITYMLPGLFVFLLSLGVYVKTLCPTVYWDDAGELIAAAYTLGIPHPPGHPLYVLLGKLFTFIPFGSIAWRMNFMSAFFGALSCFFVYTIGCQRLGARPWSRLSAACGALFFAFAPTVWEQSTVAETSTLHCFFMMMLTLLAFRLAAGRLLLRGSEVKSLCFFSLLYGLSFTNHVAGLFFAPSFAYVLILGFGRRLFSPRVIFGMMGAFLLGLSVYAYLPIRSLADPPIDWGNPETLKNFLWVVTAQQYAPNLLSPGVRSMYAFSEQLLMRGKDLLHQFAFIGAVFGFIGLFVLGRRDGKFVLFSMLVIGILFYTGLNTAFISAYFIPAIALMAVWIAVGLQHVCGMVEGLARRLQSISAAAAIRFSLCPLLVISFVLPAGLHFRAMDRSRHTYALRYGEEMLAELPENAALFTTDGYALFILWYLIYCEGERPDLMVLHPGWLLETEVLRTQLLEQYPELILPSPEVVERYVEKAADRKSKRYMIWQAILDANHAYRPVYWGMIPNDLPFYRNLSPIGILYRYSNMPGVLSEGALSRNRRFWESERDYILQDPAMCTDKVAREIYPVELNNQGLFFEQLERDDLARWAIELALEFNPEYPISRYNFGRLAARAGNYAKAVEQYKLAVEGNPYMAVAYYNLGNAYVNLNRFDEAFQAYRNAVRMYQPYHEAITGMGRLYLLAGEYEKAAERFRTALAIEPDYVFALRGLASSYLQAGQLDEAKDPLDRALAIEPDSAPGLFALAKYYACAGDRDRAVRTLIRSVEIGGDAFLDAALADEHLKELAEEYLGNGNEPRP